MAKNRNINVVVGKELRILLKPELLKPVCDLLHGSPPVGIISKTKPCDLSIAEGTRIAQMSFLSP